MDDKTNINGPNGREPGSPKTGGRKPGSLNKVTADMRQVVVEAFEELGGKSYLIKIGEERPELFIRLLATIMPKDINLNHNMADLLLEQLKERERNVIPITSIQGGTS